MKELMHGKPSDEIVSSITENIEVFHKDYDFSDNTIRIGKVGGLIITEVDYTIEKSSKMDSIVVQDQIRNNLSQIFVESTYKIRLSVNFIGKG